LFSCASESSNGSQSSTCERSCRSKWRGTNRQRCRRDRARTLISGNPKTGSSREGTPPRSGIRMRSRRPTPRTGQQCAGDVHGDRVPRAAEPGVPSPAAMRKLPPRGSNASAQRGVLPLRRVQRRRRDQGAATITEHVHRGYSVTSVHRRRARSHQRRGTERERGRQRTHDRAGRDHAS
jgi:hypothetical protein